MCWLICVGAPPIVLKSADSDFRTSFDVLRITGSAGPQRLRKLTFGQWKVACDEDIMYALLDHTPKQMMTQFTELLKEKYKMPAKDRYCGCVLTEELL